MRPAPSLQPLPVARHGDVLEAEINTHCPLRCGLMLAGNLNGEAQPPVDQYQYIVVGDVSSLKLVRTRMAKAVLDSGWGMLRQMLLYKGEHAGRSVTVVSERYTSAACSSCGSLSGPRGVNGIAVRRWMCSECGDSHDRDVNAARNILAGLRCRASVGGNESSPRVRQPSQTSPRCEAGTGALEVSA
jgi:IS605 OrfB family transposase